MIGDASRVLLLGAGGAARGVILPLLEQGCRIALANRTHARAQALAAAFQAQGAIEALPYDALGTHTFDLIINATASGLQGELPPLPRSIIRPDCACYDMFYRAGRRRFWPGFSSRARYAWLMASACWWRRRHTPSRCGMASCRR